MVAMATYFLWTYNGKVEIDYFSVSIGIFGIYFYRDVNLVVLYVSYDFCPNR